MNALRQKFVQAVRANSWDVIHPGLERKIVRTVGISTTLGTCVYLGYSVPCKEYPIASALMTVSLSVGAGSLAALASFVPSIVLAGIPVFTAVGAGRMLKEYHDEHAHIHLFK